MELKIRLLNKKDSKLVEQLWQNKKVREFLGGIPSLDYINRNFNKMIQSKNDYYFVVSYNENNIGIISVDKYHDNENYEISYQFFPDFWGKGLAYNSILLVFDYIKINTKIKIVYAETQNKNIRSKKLLERLKMIEINKIERFNELQVLYKIEFV